MADAPLEQRIEVLEARLQAAEDVQAIQRLKTRYAQLVDARYTRKGPKPAAEIEPIARALCELFTPCSSASRRPRSSSRGTSS
jgi:hypothetical protein